MAKRAKTAEERRERYLAAQRKYNQSRKGAARYARYETAHPERADNRWEPARNGLHFNRPPSGPPVVTYADGPDFSWRRELEDVDF